MKNDVLDIKKLLLFTFISIAIFYYIFLTPKQIIEIIKDEYIIIGIDFILVSIFFYLKHKLTNLTIVPYIPNTNTIPLKSTLIFFVIFQVIDFYYENGFIGMISMWFTYWTFGVLAWALTNCINLYKNYRFYLYETLSKTKFK